MLPGDGHGGGEATEERQGIEVDGDRAVAERPLEGDAHQAVGGEGEVLGGHRWPEDVLEQGFAGARVVGTGPGGGVEPEAGVLGAQGADDHEAAEGGEGDAWAAASFRARWGEPGGGGGSKLGEGGGPFRQRVADHGQAVVVSPYGRHAIWAETSDGKLRLLPLAWTSLQPRPAPLALDGRPVRLDPAALREMAAWVVARRPARRFRDREEVAMRIGEREKRGDGSAGPGPAGAEPAAAVVGQAGPPDAARGGERRERGAR